MASVRWSLRASRDLRDIVESLARRSSEAASDFVDEVTAALARIETYPHLGRVIPEYEDPSLREVLVRDYRLMYEVEPGKAGILAVLHGRQNVLKALGRAPRSW